MFTLVNGVDMNKLPLAKRAQIIGLIVEGTSLRATSRLADVSINTVTNLLVDVGTAASEYQNRTVRMHIPAVAERGFQRVVNADSGRT
jgi:transposase-like protein